MEEKLLFTIDFGTSGIKCMLFTQEGEVRARKFTPIEYYEPKGLQGIGKEFDAAEAWKTICKITKAALKEAKCRAIDVVGVAATSQRHGAVFLDEKGAPVYAGPNLDARGVFTQGAVIEELQKTCPPTGCWPPLLYALCRLLYFKQLNPDAYEQIRCVFSISDWIVYKLTGNVTTDPSQASNTQFMDIRTSEWSKEILEMADIPESLLPPIDVPGIRAGKLSVSASKATGLRRRTPVAIGGADTQCALLGSGALNPGTVCVVAGNTAPIQLVTDKPIIDEECKLWTGRYLLPERWVLEANAGTSGSVLTWFAKNIIHPADVVASRTDDELYARVERLADDAKPGSYDTIALLGPQIMDASDMATVRPAMFLFPQPASPVTMPISLNELARSLFENICYAVRANLDLLKEIAGVTFDRCLISGGLSRSLFWQQMLADVTNLEIQRSQVVEASSLGAAICAATAAKIYGSLQEGVEKMVSLQPPIRPRSEVHDIYETFFSRWKVLYKQSTDM